MTKQLFYGLAVAAVAMVTFAFTAAAANAAVVVPVAEVFGHNEQTNYNGVIADMINGSGMNGYGVDGVVTWPVGEGDPSTWTRTGSGYQQEWQSIDLLAAQTPAEDLDASGVLLGDGVGPTNNKIGWTVFDLGSAEPLETLYIWHITENSARVATSFNVHVAALPTAGVPHGPTGGGASRDYDFSSGGWTTVATGLSGTQNGSSVVDLSGNTGRYVALEILANGGDGNRVGFAEVGITAIPEPSTFALAAIGLLGLIGFGRRRKSM